MPKNKLHKVIDDVYNFSFTDDRQVTRVGLALSAMSNAKALVVSKEDIINLNNKINIEVDRDLQKIADRNYCIQLDDKYTIILVAQVSMEERTLIVVPFSNNTESGVFEPYDLYIRLENFDKKDFTMEVHAINPLAEGEDINAPAWDHAVSLSAILTAILTAIQDDSVKIVTSDEDLDKINKKRIKNKKHSIIVQDNFFEV